MRQTIYHPISAKPRLQPDHLVGNPFSQHVLGELTRAAPISFYLHCGAGGSRGVPRRVRKAERGWRKPAKAHRQPAKVLLALGEPYIEKKKKRNWLYVFGTHCASRRFHILEWPRPAALIRRRPRPLARALGRRLYNIRQRLRAASHLFALSATAACVEEASERATPCARENDAGAPSAAHRLRHAPRAPLSSCAARHVPLPLPTPATGLKLSSF